MGMLIVATILALAYTEFSTCSLCILACTFAGCTCPSFAFAHALYQTKQLRWGYDSSFWKQDWFQLGGPIHFLPPILQIVQLPWVRVSATVPYDQLQMCPPTILIKCFLCWWQGTQRWMVHQHFEIFLLHNSFLASVMLSQWPMLQHARINLSPSLYMALQSSTELSPSDVKDIPPNRNMKHVYINRK